MKIKKRITIYIDHWEDYESIGDRAMLLNAMRRIENYLGLCTFVTPYTATKPGAFLLPTMIPVSPPQNELIATASRFKAIFARFLSLLRIRILDGKQVSKFSFDLAILLINIKLFFYSIGLRFVFRQSFRDFIEQFKKCDAFFTVGDCSLSDYWLDGVIIKSWLINLAQRYIPVRVLSSQGIGPLSTAWARKRLIASLSKLNLLSFRDFENSQALVQSEGLKGVPNKIVCDEAFSYPIASSIDVWRALFNSGLNKGEEFIAVNFRKTDFTQNTSNLLQKIAGFLDQIIEKTGRKLVFVCMSSGENYGQDFEAGQNLKQILNHPDRLIILNPIDDISLVKGIIGEARYSIGLSYHLHVFSLSQGHPTLIVYTGDYYKTKSEGLVSFYGGVNKAINLQDNSVEQMLNCVSDIESYYDASCQNVSEVNRKILEINDWTIVELKEQLIKKGLLIKDPQIDLAR